LKEFIILFIVIIKTVKEKIPGQCCNNKEVSFKQKEQRNSRITRRADKKISKIKLSQTTADL
jgi:hypothetical protein